MGCGDRFYRATQRMADNDVIHEAPKHYKKAQFKVDETGQIIQSRLCRVNLGR